MKFRFLSHMCKVKLKDACAAICTMPSGVRGGQSASRRCKRACLYNRLRLCCTGTTAARSTNIIEPGHGISNNVVCATTKASDQPAHTCSLIRAIASRLNIL